MIAFRLFADSFDAKALLPDAFAPVKRILYVREGSATLRAAGQTATLGPNSAWFGPACACRVAAGADGVQLLRWELGGAVAPGGVQGVRSVLLLETQIALPAEACLMRCDRVDFPPGGVAYTHTHQGPGIRCLLDGQLRVETAGKTHVIEPGGAWFESGPDAVLATAWDQSPTSFVRVMILPRPLQGKSSIRYVKPEDADKPKPQKYQMFVDDFIDA